MIWMGQFRPRPPKGRSVAVAASGVALLAFVPVTADATEVAHASHTPWCHNLTSCVTKRVAEPYAQRKCRAKAGQRYGGCALFRNGGSVTAVTRRWGPHSFHFDYTFVYRDMLARHVICWGGAVVGMHHGSILSSNQVCRRV